MPKNLDVANIIKHSFEKNPADAEEAFNSAIMSKMADAIDARREQIASEMYGTQETQVDETGEVNEDV